MLRYSDGILTAARPTLHALVQAGNLQEPKHTMAVITARRFGKAQLRLLLSTYEISPQRRGATRFFLVHARLRSGRCARFHRTNCIFCGAVLQGINAKVVVGIGNDWLGFFERGSNRGRQQGPSTRPTPAPPVHGDGRMTGPVHIRQRKSSILHRARLAF